MPTVTLVGDGSSHGGTVITGSSTVRNQSKGLVRNGDLHSCPQPGHGTTSISSTTVKLRINGQRVVVNGCVAGCGAVILPGSSDMTTT